MELRLTGARGGSISTSSRNRRAPQPRAKKRFGQHFLRDPAILNRIVDAAELSAGQTVVEIGPGLGALTAVLAERGLRVVAVEIDHDLVPMLRARFAGAANVTIVQADVLDTTPGKLLARANASAPYAVVANLPYNIAAPVLRSFLEGDVRPQRLVVMLQLEVAEAVVALPGRMSLLSVATQVYGQARMVMKVAPGAFSPPPKVHSAGSESPASQLASTSDCA
jgi:16S rRNA (adenine1518-N6/adenine1519-N6)-dimethyltransferase